MQPLRRAAGPTRGTVEHQKDPESTMQKQHPESVPAEMLDMEDLSALTSDALLEAAEASTRALTRTLLEASQRFERLPAVQELSPRPPVHVHTRAPATPVGLFSVGRTLVVAFDAPTHDVPEIGDLLRFFTPEGDALRPAPNPLAHHAELTRALQDLYRSHRGRVQLKAVLPGPPGQVFLSFAIRQGEDIPDRTSLLGLDFSLIADLSQGLKRTVIQARAFPPALPEPDFVDLPELEEAPWKPGHPTSALYYHTRVGPLYAFVERGALKLRDRVDIPRGNADLVLEGAADPSQGIQPYRSEVLYPHTDRDIGEALLRFEPSAGRPLQYVYYSALPRRFQVLDLRSLPGWSLPGNAGRITAMFLWAGQELLYLGGRPGIPVAHHPSSGPDHLYVFRSPSGRLTLHAFDADKRRLQTSIHEVCAYTLQPDGRLFALPGTVEGTSGGTLEHTLLSWQTPFTAGSAGPSPEELAFLRSFDLNQTRAMFQTLRTLAPLVEKKAFPLARQTLDQVLLTYPFVERLTDVRAALDSLSVVLTRCLDVAAELQEIHARRRSAFAQLLHQVERLTQTQAHPDTAAPPSDLNSASQRITDLRGLRGQLEQLSGERFLPTDMLEAHAALRNLLDDQLKQTSTLARALIEERLSRVRKHFRQLDSSLPQLGTLSLLQTADEALQREQAHLNRCGFVLTQLELTAATRLKLSQQLSTFSVESERHQNSLRKRRRELSESSLREGFGAWLAQLTLRLATEPRACLDLPSCESCRDGLLAEVEGQRATLADFPDLQEQLTQTSETVRSRLEARKRELLQEKDAERTRLEGLFQLRLQSLQVTARANRLEPDALEGFIAAHPETLGAQKVLEQLRRGGFQAEASLWQGRLDQLKRLLVAERRETAAFAVEGDALVLGDVRLHCNRLSFGLQETLTAEGPGLTLTGTGLSWPLWRLKAWTTQPEALVAPPGYLGRLAETQTQSRVERLAFRALRQLEEGRRAQSLASLCRELALAHPEEEYVPDLHDRDATRLLGALWPLWRTLGTLRYPAEVRLEATRALEQLRLDSAQAGMLHPLLSLALSLDLSLETPLWEDGAGVSEGSQTFDAQHGQAPAPASAPAPEDDLEDLITVVVADTRAQGAQNAAASTETVPGAVAAHSGQWAQGPSPLDAALTTLLPGLSEAARTCLAEHLLEHNRDHVNGSAPLDELPWHPAALEAAQRVVSLIGPRHLATPTPPGHIARESTPDDAYERLLEPLITRLKPGLSPGRRREAAYLASQHLLGSQRQSGPFWPQRPEIPKGTEGSAADGLVLKLQGFASPHPRLDQGLILEPAEWYAEQLHFDQHQQPAILRFREALSQVKHRLADELKLDDLMARPLARFVWTRLTRRAYLPLIARALEKQLGSLDRSGEDQMGLLLLVSPPGYGKTELLKKIASLLGYAFVSVSGTSLSKATVGLDPATAPDASSRAALERLLFGLELQDNVLLDIEDVQACSDELLSRLLPLCDATRTLEIVRDGRPVRLSLQGRRAAIVMTLNPLLATIPQALANRATLLNLGDVADRFADDFALSYLEVGAPMNPTLEAASSRGDIEAMALALADGRSLVSLNEEEASAEQSPAAPAGPAAPVLKGRYARSELVRIQAVLEHATAIRDVLMAVNRACLASASVAEAFRIDPAFELQGSYRDMVELCRHIQPDWTQEQRVTTLLRHYEGQAGLLGERGEYNLLHFKHLVGLLTPAEADRLEHIRETYRLIQSRDKAMYVLMEKLSEVARAVHQLPETLRGMSTSLTQQLQSQHSQRQQLLSHQGETQLAFWQDWRRAQTRDEQRRDEHYQQHAAERLTAEHRRVQLGLDQLELAQQRLELEHQRLTHDTQARASAREAHQLEQAVLEQLLQTVQHLETHSGEALGGLHDALLHIRSGIFEAGGKLQSGLSQQLLEELGGTLDPRLALLLESQGELARRIELALERLQLSTEKGLGRLDLRQLLRTVLSTLPEEPTTGDREK